MGDRSLIAKKAADLLARRAHFTRELKQKLLKRGFDKQEVECVVDDFEKKGFLNDRELASSYAEELKRKQVGKLQVIKRLIDKGVSSALLSDIESGFFLENEEIRNIKYLLEKRRFNLSDVKDFRKAVSFLTNRGFEQSTVIRVLKEEKPGGFDSEDGNY